MNVRKILAVATLLTFASAGAAFAQNAGGQGAGGGSSATAPADAGAPHVKKKHHGKKKHHAKKAKASQS